MHGLYTENLFKRTTLPKRSKQWLIIINVLFCWHKKNIQLKPKISPASTENISNCFKCSISVGTQRQHRGMLTFTLCNHPFELMSWITPAHMLRHADTLSQTYSKCCSDSLFLNVFSDLLPGNHRHIWQKEHAALHLLYTCTQVISPFLSLTGEKSRHQAL